MRSPGFAGETGPTRLDDPGLVRAMGSRVTAMRVAICSTYPPRVCGIGSFAFDLRTALVEVEGIESVGALVVVDAPTGGQRPEVLSIIRQAVGRDYVEAARAVALERVDVVLLQHEYGIFGGPDGEYVLSFAEALAQPLVVTLHTVVSRPTQHQLRVLSALCERAELVVVMTDTAATLLDQIGACDPGKIRVVPHGAPALLAQAAEERPAGRPLHLRGWPVGHDVQGRFLLSTFGLLSSGKGLETVIEAMPFVVERHPDVLYLISGETHPEVVEREGERYRHELQRRIAELGLAEHVAFDDRYLSLAELAELLAATEIFITPYRNPEQIVSGALTFALTAGRAVISTPYRYAEDMLSTGAGRLVPFDDPQAFARAICELIEDPDALAATRDEARRIGAAHLWSSVAERTAAVLREGIELDPPRMPPLRRRRSLRSLPPRGLRSADTAHHLRS